MWLFVLAQCMVLLGFDCSSPIDLICSSFIGEERQSVASRESGHAS